MKRIRKVIENTTSVTIIVVFKNELDNLNVLIPMLLQQAYHDFEILLVNDFSSDGSENFIESIKSEKIRLIHASKNVKGKKFALREALAMSNGDLILLTDADCRPNSNLWIETMVKTMEPHHDVVLGYGPLEFNSTVISKLSAFEAWFNTFQSFSLATKGFSYLGVGRNLLIRKSAIQLDHLFVNSNSISGDDDLLVQHVSTGKNISIGLNENSYVSSQAKSNWHEYIGQKTRHLSTSWEYKPEHKFLLGLYGASHGMLILSFFLLLLNLNISMTVLLSFLIFSGSKWVIAIKGMEQIRDHRFRWTFPLYDLFMGINYWLLLFLLFKKTNKW